MIIQFPYPEDTSHGRRVCFECKQTGNQFKIQLFYQKWEVAAGLCGLQGSGCLFGQQRDPEL